MAEPSGHVQKVEMILTNANISSGRDPGIMNHHKSAIIFHKFKHLLRDVACTILNVLLSSSTPVDLCKFNVLGFIVFYSLMFKFIVLLLIVLFIKNALNLQ